MGGLGAVPPPPEATAGEGGGFCGAGGLLEGGAVCGRGDAGAITGGAGSGIAAREGDACPELACPEFVEWVEGGVGRGAVFFVCVFCGAGDESFSSPAAIGSIATSARRFSSGRFTAVSDASSREMKYIPVPTTMSASTTNVIVRRGYTILLCRGGRFLFPAKKIVIRGERRFYRITRGNVVLLIRIVGDVARGKHARNRCRGML